MRHLFLIMLLFLFSAPAQGQTQHLTRAAPMGERTSMFGIYPYLSPNKKVSFAYYLMGPKDAQSGVKYPLIVMLHGRSGHAYGGWVLADEIEKNGMPVFVVVPSMEEDIDDWTAKKFLWADLKHPRPIDHVALLTKRLIAELPIDPAKVYVTGYSMGGVGTFGMLAAYPDLFAAGVPICGGWYPEDAPKFTNMPIWAFHGAADSIVSVSQTRNIISAIEKVGGAPKYTEYPGVDHNSWVRAYNDPALWSWLLLQTKRRP